MTQISKQKNLVDDASGFWDNNAQAEFFSGRQNTRNQQRRNSDDGLRTSQSKPIEMNPNNTGIVKGDNIFGASDMRSQRTGSSAMISDNIARMAPENGLESFVRDRPPQKIIEDADSIQCFKSQLSINCPYASNEFASRFCVCNPRRSPKGDFILYTVLGED